MPAEIFETIEVEGPAGRIVINKHDLASYQERGYKLATEVPSATPPDVNAETPAKRTK
jgi:hypothetical protein